MRRRGDGEMGNRKLDEEMRRRGDGETRKEETRRWDDAEKRRHFTECGMVLEKMTRRNGDAVLKEKGKTRTLL